MRYDLICEVWLHVWDITSAVRYDCTSEIWLQMYDMTHSHTCDMAHSYVWHHLFISVPWLIHQCTMTHSWVLHTCFLRFLCHDSFVSTTWVIPVWWDAWVWLLLYMSAVCFRSLTWLISYVYGTCLICAWDMTYSYVAHGSFPRGTWLIHICDMTHWYQIAARHLQHLSGCCS